jgi:hypothetical protein
MTRTANIRSKLDELKVRDRQLESFGAAEPHGHGYRELPRLEAAGVARLESAFDIELPSELRAFLMDVHGGGAGPGYGFFIEAPCKTTRPGRPFPYGAGDVAAFTAGSARRAEGLPLVDDPDDDDDWPPGSGFVAIAHHGCGCIDVIVTAGEQRGLIWFCDMQWFPRLSPSGPLGFFDWFEGWLDDQLRFRRPSG